MIHHILIYTSLLERSAQEDQVLLLGVSQYALDHVQVADLEGRLVVYYRRDLFYQFSALDLGTVVYQHRLHLSLCLSHGLKTGLHVLVDFDFCVGRWLPFKEQTSTQRPQKATCLLSQSVKRWVISDRFQMISCRGFSPSTLRSVPVAIYVMQLTMSKLPNLQASFKLSLTLQKMTTERSNCTLSRLMPICEYSNILVCWLTSMTDCEIGLMTWRPGVRIFSKWPHYCSRPRFCMGCWKSGLALQGQQGQKRKGQHILQGMQQFPSQDRKAGQQYFSLVMPPSPSSHTSFLLLTPSVPFLAVPLFSNNRSTVSLSPWTLGDSTASKFFIWLILILESSILDFMAEYTMDTN